MCPKFSALFLFLAFACIAQESYKLVWLGDIHYDGKDYRDQEYFNSLPKSKQDVQKRNLNSWCEGGLSHKMLATAGEAAKDALFAFQVGDFTHGYAGTEDMAIKMQQGCIEVCKKHIHIPLYFVKGNHEPNGPGSAEALDKTLLPYLTKELQLKEPLKDYNFVRKVGPDVFIFWDSISAKLPQIKELIDQNPAQRHLFIVCHLPIIPVANSGKIRWIPFGKVKNDNLRHEFLDLLCSKNAIVLCGHVHKNTCVEYTNEKGTLVQVTSISLFGSEKLANLGKIASGGVKEYLARKEIKSIMEKQEKAETEEKPKQDEHVAEFINEYMPGLKRFDQIFGAGYCVLKVGPEGVFNEFHGILSPDQVQTSKLR